MSVRPKQVRNFNENQLPYFGNRIQPPSLRTSPVNRYGKGARFGAFYPDAQAAQASGLKVQKLGGTRSPAGKAGIRRASVDTKITPIDNAALGAFVAAHPECKIDAASVQTFLTNIDRLQYNGVDIQAVFRAAYDAGIVQQNLNVSDTRTGNYGLSTTAGKGTARKASGKRIKNSILWEVVTKACDRLPALNAFINDIDQGQLGARAQTLNIPYREYTAEQVAQANQAVAAFVAQSQQCQDVDPGVLAQFLALVDSYQLNGADLFAVFHTIGLEPNDLPSQFQKYAYRSGTTQNGLGVGLVGPRKQGQKAKSNVLKYSILWAILEKYCHQIATVLPEINALLSGQFPQVYNASVLNAVNKA